jgi:hypothetical protein
MFVGHFAVGFGAKAAAPQVSLGTLFLAAQLADLLWPTLLLLGVEHVRIEPGATRVTPLVFTHYPISHSLLGVIAWGTLAALVYLALRRSLRGALVVGLLVASHWLLDLVVHAPDLPLAPGGRTLLGLGLWNSPAGTIVVELAIFALGVWLYLRTTVASDRTGMWALWSLIAFLLLIYFLNLFGPPPPDVTTIAWVGQAQWLLVLWGWWVDRHRRPKLRR